MDVSILRYTLFSLLVSYMSITLWKQTFIREMFFFIYLFIAVDPLKFKTEYT